METDLFSVTGLSLFAHQRLRGCLHQFRRYIRVSYLLLTYLPQNDLVLFCSPQKDLVLCYHLNVSSRDTHASRDHFCLFRRPASHLVSRHFRQQFLSYLYQIWHAGLLG